MSGQRAVQKTDATNVKIPPCLWRAAIVIGAGAFLAMMDSTVINLAVGQIDGAFGDFPTPRQDHAGSMNGHSGLSVGTLAVSSYLLAMAVSLPLTAWIGNRIGDVRAWRFVLALFLGASVLCALAQSPTILIAGRIAQGLAAGVMVPLGQAYLGRVAGRRQLGRIMGSIGFAVALGPALGPAIGGWLIDAVSWRYVFWLNIPIGGLALIAALFLDDSAQGNIPHKGFDGWGYMVLVTGLVFALSGAMFAQQPPYRVLGCVTIVAGSLVLIWFFKGRTAGEQGIIDPGLLRKRLFRACFWGAGMTAMNMYGGLLLLPTFLAVNADMELPQIGGLLFFLGIGAALMLPVCGILCDRFGCAPVMLAGVAILVVDTLILTVSGRWGFGGLAAVLMLRGAGLALAQMPAVTGAYLAVNKVSMGDAATLINLVQRVGGCMGVVVIAILVAGPEQTDTLPAMTFLILLATGTLLPACAALRAQKDVNVTQS